MVQMDTHNKSSVCVCVCVYYKENWASGLFQNRKHLSHKNGVVRIYNGKIRQNKDEIYQPSLRNIHEFRKKKKHCPSFYDVKMSYIIQTCIFFIVNGML